MKPSDVKFYGYPDTEFLLSHFDALPVLIQALKETKNYKALAEWDKARNPNQGHQDTPVIITTAGRKQ